VRRLAPWFAIGAIILALTGAAEAQDFPSRTVRIVLGYGPGGLGDILCRALGETMSKSIGQPVIVENMPGAGGATAALAVARAAPDGHSVLFASSQNAIALSMFKSLPYDWSRDFTPVGTISTNDFVLFVDKNSPLKTVQDVIAAAKRDPSKFNFGSIGVGSGQNLSAVKFASMTGLAVPTVAFRTTGEVVAGLLSGNIQAAFETLPAVIGQIRGGAMRAIAVASDKRVSFLPDVPTVTESGVQNYRIKSWSGLVLPAKTPQGIVMRLNQELNKAIATPEMQTRLRDLTLEPLTGTPQDLQKIYQADVVMWHQIVTEAKITPN
jgi:tripartite-type tricarboxylate transporter receptor subunit TctC